MSLVRPWGKREQAIKGIIKSISPTKDLFYLESKEKPFDVKKEIEVAYGLDEKQQAGLCGTAFDYLARFCIARIAEDNRRQVLENTVAEAYIRTLALQKVEFSDKIRERFGEENVDILSPNVVILGNVISYSYLSQQFGISKEDAKNTFKSSIHFQTYYISNDKEIRKELMDKYVQLMDPVRKYVHGDSVDEETLIDISIVLARIENMGRGGRGAIPISKLFDFDVANKCVREELKKLLESFKKTFLPLVCSDSRVVYNPVFGIGSRMVEGADADIYIDGVLYDFKTSVKNGWSSSDATQIAGYYLLDKIAKRVNDEQDDLLEYTIRKLALYKVRYEEIAYFDVEEMPADSLEEAIKQMSIIYLTDKMHLFLYRSTASERVKKLGIPLSFEELRKISIELEWLIQDGEEISEREKQKRDELLEKRCVLRNYLEKTDVFWLLRELMNE